MKRIMFLTAVALAALFSANVVAAAETYKTYTVQAGDCLSVIGKKLSVNWKELAIGNDIKPPYDVIYPGDKLIYNVNKEVATQRNKRTIAQSDKKIVTQSSRVITRSKKKIVTQGSREFHQVRYLGRNKFRGQGNLDLAWKQFGLSEEDKKELRGKIETGQFDDMEAVKKGDTFDLGMEGKNKLQTRPVMAWVDHDVTQLEAAKVYRLSSGKEIWILLKCGNPYLRIVKKEVVPEPVPSVSKVIEVGKVPKFVYKDLDFFYIPPVKTNFAIEHEPIIGAWMWQNELAKGKGWYAEYVAYLRQESIYGYANGWSPGLGLYYMDSDGSSRVGTYSWDETAKGFQAGMKYTSPEFQWSTKFRLVWEEIDGRNNEGYSMHQEGIKPGVYTEYLDWTHLKDGWLWGVTAEAWLPISEDISSTWVDDIPADRSQVALNFFIQKKLNEDWQTRVAGGIFWQEWDDLIGLRAQAELRWKEIIMFGPWVSVFPFGISDAYMGVSAWDLTTVGAFVRLEVAGILRIADRERRMKAVKEADRKWLDDLLTQNNL